MYQAISDLNERTALHQKYGPKSWLERNSKFLLGGTIVVLLALLGVSMYHKNGGVSMTGLEAIAPGDLPVGSSCSESDECKACVDPKDTPTCSENKKGKKVCRCKVHLLSPEEKCLGTEECTKTPCQADGKHRHCSKSKSVCECVDYKIYLGLPCDSYKDCEECKDPAEFTRCSGFPPVCKCRPYRFLPGEECSESKECAVCPNPADKAHCSEDRHGRRICMCKDRLLRLGDECLDREECQHCDNPAEFRRCSNDHLVEGSPKVCKCRPYAAILGERCHINEACEECKNKDEAAVCEANEGELTKVCQCKVLT